MAGRTSCRQRQAAGHRRHPGGRHVPVGERGGARRGARRQRLWAALGAAMDRAAAARRLDGGPGPRHVAHRPQHLPAAPPRLPGRHPRARGDARAPRRQAGRLQVQHVGGVDRLGHGRRGALAPRAGRDAPVRRLGRQGVGARVRRAPQERHGRVGPELPARSAQIHAQVPARVRVHTCTERAPLTIAALGACGRHRRAVQRLVDGHRRPGGDDARHAAHPDPHTTLRGPVHPPCVYAPPKDCRVALASRRQAHPAGLHAVAILERRGRAVGQAHPWLQL